MEYLSLQDIPHRQYDPLHSHRMAHSSERQVGSMAAAVSPDIFYQFSAPPSPNLPQRSASLSPPHSYLHLPPPKTGPRPSPVFPDYDRARHPSRCGSFSHRGYETQTFPAAMEDDLRRYSSKSLNLTKEQSQFLRNSPPIQPGEPTDKLPSFSEVRLTSVARQELLLTAKVLTQYAGAHTTTDSIPPKWLRR
jgi:hypothetical protein